jgi:hypothetical protein
VKALSIKQPWAWLIIHGGKDIENRKWKTKFRGRFLVHASKGFDHDAAARFADILPNELRGGGIIGSVELVDCVSQSDSKWFEGPNGFVLKDPQPLEFKEVKGKLRFFEAEG